MIHLSYAQELALIERLLTALDVPEDDAASLAAVVTHSDFTGTDFPASASISDSIWQAR